MNRKSRKKGAETEKARAERIIKAARKAKPTGNAKLAIIKGREQKSNHY